MTIMQEMTLRVYGSTGRVERATSFVRQEAKNRSCFILDEAHHNGWLRDEVIFVIEGLRQDLDSIMRDVGRMR